MPGEDPFVAMAGGRCWFRYEDLLKLADLVATSVKTRSAYCKGNWVRTVKINRTTLTGSIY